MDVIPLTGDRLDEAAGALARALFDDPLQAYVYPDLDERREKGPEHFAVLARAATMFGEPTTTPDVAGAALCMPPGGDLNAERAQAAGFPRLWELLGPEGIGRLGPVLDHLQGLAQTAVSGDNWYVMAIGVAPEYQSRGIGSGLLQPMIARADADGVPSAQPSLVDLTINGQTVPALVQPTKQGELFVLDRRDGRPILPVREEPAPQGAAEGDKAAPTQPVSALSYGPPPLTERDMWGATPFDQLACRIQFHQLRYDGRFTPPSTQGTLVYPGNFGVFNWGSIAVDPQRQIAFTTPTYLAFVSRLVPRADDKTLYVQGANRPQGSLPALNENFGAPFAVQLHAFISVLGVPCQAPPWGYVAAADLTTGKILWMHRNGTVRGLSPVPLPFRMGVPNLGGPVVTAGGVAFLSGTLDYYLRAYDVSTGAELWKSRLPAGGQATPMAYIGDDGRQFVLVAAGGHGSLGTKAGDFVIAYALPRS
jgi:GNAT superfamily N-acetyltransferase